jgi:MFS family permease
MAETASGSGWYRNYVLVLLTLLYMSSFLDSNLIVLLVEPIKHDLHVSDSKIGFLVGIASGLFYAVLGLPIARWADRGDRVNMSAAAIGIWSIAVMLCLLVTNFAQLVSIRIAATVGQAGCLPPTYSLVGDYFPRASERTRAISLFMLASPLSSLVSFGLGGWLFEHFGWRWAMFTMGIPGVVLAVLTKSSVKEPRIVLGAPLRLKSPELRSVLVDLWQQRAARNLTIAIILIFTAGNGLVPWYGAFLIRSHGVAMGELGFWFATIFGLGGMGGILLGAYSARRWFSGNEAGQLYLCAIMVVAMAPLIAVFLLVPGKYAALAALIPVIVVSSVFYGPVFALLQRLVVDNVRATALAVVMLLANLIGMGVGPQLVGTLSDVFEPDLKRDSLRYAMLAVSLLSLWAGYHLLKAGRSVEGDLSKVAQSPVQFPIAVQ